MKSKFFFFLLFFAVLSSDEFCPFCDPEIAAKQEVYRGSHWHVLVDYRPVLEGHLLIVPIQHRLTRHELTREEHNELYEIEKKVQCVFTRRFGSEVEDFQYEKNGPTLQSVHHFHIHAIPFDSKMKSFIKKIGLFAKLFLLPPSKLSHEEALKEQELFRNLFNECSLLDIKT